MITARPAVVLLGAAEYPESPSLDNPAFRGSYEGFRDYCAGPLGVPDERILDLFGSTAAPGETVHRIQRFLAGGPAQGCTVVIVHYVGHGDRVGHDRQYALFTAASRKAAPDSSSLHLSHLDEATREAGRSKPVVFLIDACFAAAAAAAFRQPVGSAGLAVFASASSGDTSLVPEGSDTTAFTAGLLAVLARGEPRRPPMMSLRDLNSLVATAIPAGAAKPEVHSPRQRKGDPADLGIFPNAAFAARSGDPDDTGLPWCAVTSQSDTAGSFNLLVRRFAGRARWKIQENTGRLLRSSPAFVDAGTVFAGPDSFREAVAAVCSADLALFDLTDLEPAVLVLLGIRAVIRRGVTICSVAKGSGELLLAPPFLLRDINFVEHDPHGDDVRLFRDRAVAGMTEMLRTPHRYADLPGFEAIRQLPAGSDAPPQVPYDQRVLVLCSFDSRYNRDNWPDVKGAISAVVERRAQREVRVERTLEMTSTRLVSANLLEAIRFTDFCLCDLTGWRPNVLFELGLRLAANPIEPVCVIDRDAARPDRPGRDRDQWDDLIGLLGVLEYTPGQDADFERMLDRHLHNVQLEQTRRLGGGDGVYAEAWRHADPGSEQAAADVVTLLQQAASDRASHRRTGSSPLVFPTGHPLAAVARRSAVEALAAAWLYLRHRGTGRPDRLEVMKDVGNRLVALLRDSPDEADRRWAIEVFDELDRLEGNDDGE